jgi:hypothetical protein
MFHLGSFGSPGRQELLSPGSMTDPASLSTPDDFLNLFRDSLGRSREEFTNPFSGETFESWKLKRPVYRVVVPNPEYPKLKKAYSDYCKDCKKASEALEVENYKVLFPRIYSKGRSKEYISVRGIEEARRTASDVAKYLPEGSEILIRYSHELQRGNVGYNEPNQEYYKVTRGEAILTRSPRKIKSTRQYLKKKGYSEEEISDIIKERFP